jgi:glycosyltransferase involved in cell wall biosynthesis
VVERAVQSVFAQTFTDYELIVVDDGSDDATPEALTPYNGKLKFFAQPNRGVSAARNQGCKLARGELLAFLDSDDEWLPNKLMKQAALFNTNDSVFICHTDEIWMRGGREVPQKGIHRRQGGRFFERALERCLISPSSVMISRDLLDSVGLFDEDLPAAEDYDLWLRITAFHDVHFLPEALVIKHGGNTDQLSMAIPAIDRFRILAITKILRHPDLPGEYRQAAILELIRKCRIVASGCMKKGKDSEAEEYRELARSYEGHLRKSP